MSQYKNEEHEHYIISQLEKVWEKNKPFNGLTILVNAHITSITCVLIELLRTAGATVDASAHIELFAQPDYVKKIQDMGVSYYADGAIPEEKRQHYYDIVFDCSAGMLTTIKPKIGMVELTHTDIALYKEINFPVITIDNSRTKYLETGFGTGDSVTRVLVQLAKDAIARMTELLNHQAEDATFSHFSNHQLHIGLLGLMDVNHLFKTKKYMIFGYGKVGKGIASALKNAGVPAEHICIVDILPEAYIKIKEDGFHGLYLNNHDETSFNHIKNQIKLYLQQVFGVITATGVKNTISDIFEPSDFKHVPILMNMGTLDEFGYKFSRERIINNKKPANFLLPYPTQLKFLDAIFSVYAMAGHELCTRKLTNGYHTISEATDQAVLSNWVHHYGDDIWAYAAEKLSVNDIISSLIKSLDIESCHSTQMISKAAT